MKTITIGNSGSGKTWLAAKLAETVGLSVIHLDELFWEPGGFDKKRPKETVLQLIEQAKANPAWIVEGVFGELAKRFSDEADFLVWLDIDWTTCRERLIRRGSASKKHMAREQTEEGLSRLIEWASHYYDRTDLRSHAGHQDLFQRFPGQKIHIHSEAQANMIVKYAQRGTAADALARAAKS
jgi:adenylate kinase family enzyme